MIAAFVAALALAGGVDDTFRRANQDYFRGDFAAAAGGYRRVVDLGVASADVYYNLGNAELRAGRIGPAIWSYERARALAPGDDDVVWNLAAARRQAETRWRDRLRGESVEPWWARLVMVAFGPAVPPAFAGAWCGVFAALLLRRVSRGMVRAGLAVAAGLLGVAALVLGLVWGGRAMHDRLVRRAIVLPDEVAAAEGPDERARVTFRVHGGLDVRIVDRDGPWLRVRLPNGLEGWVRDRDIGRL